MSWELRIARAAQRSLRRFPERDQRRLVAALAEMPADPFAGDVVRLKMKAVRYRRRVGSYRILFGVDTERAHVLVFGIERRTSTTYRRRG